MRASVKKRTYNLDVHVIGKVRRLFDAKTDSEAIRRALQKTIEDREIQDSLDSLLSRGRFNATYR